LSVLTVAFQTAAAGGFGLEAILLAMRCATQDSVALGGLPLAWWLYHHRGGGARALDDPRGAIQFLFLIPGLSAALVALGQAPMAYPTAQAAGFGLWLIGTWLAWALGVLSLAPPLLVLATPWLQRRGWIKPENQRSKARPATPVVERLGNGDLIEIAGLAVGTTAFSLFALLQGRHELVSLHLWGAPLLLIVWASMRQGLLGATITAAAATSVPLLVLSFRPAAAHLTLLLQANLLAQCSTAMLVASSSSWLRARETRYRQVVCHIPVVLYSVRLSSPATVGDKPRVQGQAQPRLSGLFKKTMPPAEVTLVSTAGEALLGCPSEDLLGPFERWMERVHPEDREVLRAALAQLERQVQPVTCEYRLPRNGHREPGHGDPQAVGGDRWVRDTLAPFLDSEGRLLGWEGVISDITEQRLLAADLRRTSSMLNALVANLPTGVFFVQGTHGLPILVNARARQLLGREDLSASLEQLPQVYRLYRADGSPYPVEELPVWQALRQHRTSMREDLVVHRPDGRRIPLVTWAAPVSLGPGAGSAAVWVLEDLTALHQAEAARHDNDGRLRTVVDLMATGLVLQDRKGVIVDANAKAANLLGCDPNRLLGESLLDAGRVFLSEDGTVLPPERHPSLTALRLGRPVRNVVLGICQKVAQDAAAVSTPLLSPVVRWVLTTAIPLGSGSGASGVVTTFTDIPAHLKDFKRVIPAPTANVGTTSVSEPLRDLPCP
jgi:PAS domain-containing protein